MAAKKEAKGGKGREGPAGGKGGGQSEEATFKAKSRLHHRSDRPASHREVQDRDRVPALIKQFSYKQPEPGSRVSRRS